MSHFCCADSADLGATAANNACLHAWVLTVESWLRRERERERESRLNKRALSLFSHVKFVCNFKSQVNSYRELFRHGSETLNYLLWGGKKDGSSRVRSKKLVVHTLSGQIDHTVPLSILGVTFCRSNTDFLRANFHRISLKCRTEKWFRRKILIGLGPIYL